MASSFVKFLDRCDEHTIIPVKCLDSIHHRIGKNVWLLNIFHNALSSANVSYTPTLVKALKHDLAKYPNDVHAKSDLKALESLKTKSGHYRINFVMYGDVRDPVRGQDVVFIIEYMLASLPPYITVYYPDGSFGEYRFLHGDWEHRAYSCGSTPLFQDMDDFLKPYEY